MKKYPYHLFLAIGLSLLSSSSSLHARPWTTLLIGVCCLTSHTLKSDADLVQYNEPPTAQDLISFTEGGYLREALANPHHTYPEDKTPYHHQEQRITASYLSHQDHGHIRSLMRVTSSPTPEPTLEPTIETAPTPTDEKADSDRISFHREDFFIMVGVIATVPVITFCMGMMLCYCYTNRRKAQRQHMQSSTIEQKELTKYVV